MTTPKDESKAWALAQAENLEQRGGQTNGREWAYLHRPYAAPALEFLRLHAPSSVFYETATTAFAKDGGQPASTALRLLAGVLRDWVAFVDAGFVTQVPYAARARADAATDLMEQVQTLLDDVTVHPAAPVVLAGAALEELLRSLVDTHAATVSGKPGITAYAQALRSVSVLTAQDVKDVVAWAGQRNEAAHGEFDKLSRQRAQIMVDGINLFTRQKGPVTTS